MSLDTISGVLKNYFAQKSVVEHIIKPQSPKQARSIFPVSAVLGQNEPRKTFDFRVYSGRPLAGVISEGTTAYPKVSYGKYEDRSVNVIKLGASDDYTSEDQERVKQAMQIMSSLTINSASVQLVQQYLPTDPAKLTESLDNSLELISFYGERGLETIRQDNKVKIENAGKVFGLLNTPEIDNIDVDPSGNGSTNEEKRAWENKTGLQIFEDVRKAVNYIRNATNKVRTLLPDTMLVSSEVSELLDIKFFNEKAGVMVSEQIKKVYGIDIVSCDWISKQNDDDVNRFVLYKKDSSVLSLILPIVPFVQLPFEQKKDVIEVSFKTYTAGLAVKQPSAVLICNGI